MFQGCRKTVDYWLKTNQYAIINQSEFGRTNLKMTTIAMHIDGTIIIEETPDDEVLHTLWQIS
jgi:hypothetical protein